MKRWIYKLDKDNSEMQFSILFFEETSNQRVFDSYVHS